MISEEQRAFMRSLMYAYHEDKNDPPWYPTDFYIDWLVTVYETGEPPQEWKMVKEL